jgi:hypothetical protein
LTADRVRDHGPGSYNCGFRKSAMEAEHINLIAKRLTDVESRAAELRRYL